MQDYYAARASEYDKVYLKPERQADLREMEGWLEREFDGRHVLEVACGTGYWTQFIARSALHITAIDAVAETIEVARSRVSGKRVTYLVEDAYALPALSPLPDAGFAGFWLSHVPRVRLKAFLGVFGASLQPGSKVVLIDNLFVEGSSTPIAETDDEGNTYQIRVLRSGKVHKVLKNFPTESELRALLEGIGTDIRYRAWHHYWAVEYVVAKT